MSFNNQCNFVGNLTRDPELRYTQNGAAVINFTLAVDDSYTNKQDELVKRAYFFEFEAWARTAEAVSQFKKGERLSVESSALTKEWTDPEGNKRTKIVFKAFKVERAERQAKPEESGQEEAQPQVPF